MYQNRRGGFRRGSTAPVQVGEELDVTIEAVGEKGDGIAKKDGFVLFIPGVKEGERVRVRVTKVLRKVGFAEVVGKGEAPAAAAPAAEDTETFGEEAVEEEPEAEEPEAEEPATEDTENFGEEAEAEPEAEEPEAEEPAEPAPEETEEVSESEDQ